MIFFSYGLLIGCATKRNEAMFELLDSDHTSIDFVNHLNNSKVNIIEYLYYYNGGGVATGDINDDGLVDIYFTSNEGTNRLYLNEGNFQFSDITAKAGVGCAGEWSTGVTMADVNGDKLVDIYVCQVSGYKGIPTTTNKLFINNGDLTFREESKLYGLDFSGFSTQSVFFDADEDGDLDMYLLNHAVHTERSYGSSSLRYDYDSLAGDRFYLNEDTGNGFPVFRDRTFSSGIYSSQIGYGLGVTVADFNRDGLLDVYVCNDFHENDYLYINLGSGKFKESIARYTSYTSRYSMGVDAADINNDGLMDIVTVDMLPDDPKIKLKSASEDTQEIFDIKLESGYEKQFVKNCVQLNQGDHFVEISSLIGVAATDWSWGPLVCDLDNNSFNDFFITNGIYKRPNDLDYIQFLDDFYTNIDVAGNDVKNETLIDKMPTLKMANGCFGNFGKLRFIDKGSEWGFDTPSYSNGASYADLDNDGDLDLVVNNINMKAFVYRNNQSSKINNFIEIDLLNNNSKNVLGIGANVMLYLGDTILVKENILTRGFLSSVPPTLHFGLGKITKIDSIVVRWNSKERQVFEGVNVNTRVVLNKQSGNIENDRAKKVDSSLITRVTFPYVHNEDYHKDYYSEPLLPFTISNDGPALAIGDVNGDGLDDIYLGSSRGNLSSLIIQNSNEYLRSTELSQVFSSDSLYEETDAVFFDVDNDSDLDLYVVSGGNDLTNVSYMGDRLFINSGNGIYHHRKEAVPYYEGNRSCVRPADIDGDGDIDLFVGVKSVPGLYGKIPESVILINDGSGLFKISQKLRLGMVTDACWTDLFKDGTREIVVVGDWMKVSIFEIRDSKVIESPINKVFIDTEGFWKCVDIGDLNGDSFPDIVLGNIGDNSLNRPSSENPIELYLAETANTNFSRPIILYDQKGRKIPLATKLQLSKFFPSINKRHLAYEAFSDFNGIMSFEQMGVKTIFVSHVNTFKTSVYLSEGRSFSLIKLPLEAQYSCVNDILIDDYNSDGLNDLFFVGNTSSNTVNFGTQLGQSKALLVNCGNLEFKYEKITTHYDFKKSHKGIKKLKIAGKAGYLVSTNRDSLELVMFKGY